MGEYKLVHNYKNQINMPLATTNSFGAVKAGTGLLINDGILTVDTTMFGDGIGLYYTTGYNENGAMTQKATTEAIEKVKQDITNSIVTAINENY